MHQPRPFALERLFASREHLATHRLSPSDCESLRVEDLLTQVAQLKDYTTICSSAPGELLAMVAIEHGPEIIHRDLEIVETNLVIARGLFDALPRLLQLNTGSGGSVLLPRFTGEVSAAHIAHIARQI